MLNYKQKRILITGGAGFLGFHLCENIISLIGSTSKIIYRPLPEDDPKQRKPDMSLAMNKLDWKPEVDLLQGLQRTIKYFSELLICVSFTNSSFGPFLSFERILNVKKCSSFCSGINISGCSLR